MIWSLICFPLVPKLYLGTHLSAQLRCPVARSATATSETAPPLGQRRLPTELPTAGPTATQLK